MTEILIHRSHSEISEICLLVAHDEASLLYTNHQLLCTDYYIFIKYLLYMFRASSAHLQEDTVVHMQHMVLSLSMRVPGGLSVHSVSVLLKFVIGPSLAVWLFR